MRNSGDDGVLMVQFWLRFWLVGMVLLLLSSCIFMAWACLVDKEIMVLGVYMYWVVRWLHLWEMMMVICDTDDGGNQDDIDLVVVAAERGLGPLVLRLAAFDARLVVITTRLSYRKMMVVAERGLVPRVLRLIPILFSPWYPRQDYGIVDDSGG